MSELLLIKRHGSLHPMTEADTETLNAMESGAVYRMKWSKPRNGQFLRKYFVLLDVLFELWTPDNVQHGNRLVSEKNIDLFREQLTIAVGHHDIYIGINGQAKAVARSISFAKMDEVEFAKLYSRTIDYALKHIITRKDQSFETIDNWVSEIMSFT